MYELGEIVKVRIKEVPHTDLSSGIIGRITRIEYKHDEPILLEVTPKEPLQTRLVLLDGWYEITKLNEREYFYNLLQYPDGVI